MKRNHLLSLISLCLTVAAGCGLLTESQSKKDGAVDRASISGLATSGSVQALATDGTAGMRHFMQLRQSMSAVTGVNATDNDVNTLFQGARNRLSLMGAADTVSPAMLLAMTSLAGLYCNKLIAVDFAIGAGAASTRRAFSMITITGNTSQLVPAVREQLFQRLAELFWRRAATPAEVAILNTTLDEALAGRTVSTAELRAALLVACTAVLSSLEFLQG
jgi:hypothetical protein